MDPTDELLKIAKPAEGNPRIGLLEAYAGLGRTLGFNPEFLGENGVQWSDRVIGSPQVRLEVQFGGKESLYQSLSRLVQGPTDLIVLVTSSAAHALALQDQRRLLQSKFALGSKRVILLDVETKKFLKINFDRSEAFASQPPGPLPYDKGGRAPAPRPDRDAARPPFSPGRRDQFPTGTTLAEHARYSPSSPRHGRRKMIYGRKGEHKEQD